MTLRILVFLSLLLGAVPLARADEPAPGRVLIVRTGHEPACLDLAGLARAVGRHAARATLVVDADTEPGATDTTVRLAARDGSARVELRHAGQVVRQKLTVEPCDTLPEQVGAFVASSLTEAEAEPEPAPEAENAAPPPAPSPEIPAPADLAQRRRAERAAILAGALDDLDQPSATAVTVIGGFEAGTFAVLGVTGALTDDLTFAGKTYMTTAGVIGTLGGIGTMLLHDSDAAEPVLGTTAGVALGLTLMSLAEPHRNQEGSFFHPGGFVLGATYVGLSLGYGFGRLYRPSLATWRVHAHYRAIATAAARDLVSDEELAATERDLEAWNGPYPAWMRAAPFAIGALVSVALVSRYEDNDDQLQDLLIWGVGANCVGAAMSMLIATPFESYPKRLRAAHLDLRVTPTAEGAMLGLSGTF